MNGMSPARRLTAIMVLAMAALGPATAETSDPDSRVHAVRQDLLRHFGVCHYSISGAFTLRAQVDQPVDKGHQHAASHDVSGRDR